ncbi:MAG: FAD binding domain-containing protein [Burkholderiales bacterium]
MKPPKFQYMRAANLAEALDALQTPDAKLIAGGQSLLPLLNFRMLRPSLLVDVNRIAELSYLEETPAGGLRIGALTRHHCLETSPIVRNRFPVLASAAEHIGHLAIRNRGTIGGSLSHADPTAELLLMGVLLDATLAVASKESSRSVRIRDHIAGALSTTLEPHEIVTAVELPPLAIGTGWGFEECARRTGDFAIAAVAVLVEAAGGRAKSARIAVAGAANGPVRVPQAEAALAGSACEGKALDAAVEAVRESVDPNVDLHASAELRHRIIETLLRRTCAAAWRRATGGGA